MIGVDRGTRLAHIERFDAFWRVWTAINSTVAPREKRYGTFLDLYDTGRVERTTIRPDGEETMIVKE